VLESIPIRWRLALTSAGLTFAILCGFAMVIGQLTSSRIRSDFDNEQAAAVDELRDRLRITFAEGRVKSISPDLDLYAAGGNAEIRLLSPDGLVFGATKGAPNWPGPLERTSQVAGFRVETRKTQLRYGDRLVLPVAVQYGRRLSDLEATVGRLRLFLLFGVLAGTAMALGAGLLLARRAMAPVTDLTKTAKEIALTGDLRRRVPIPDGEDEVAELAETLDDMLQALEGSRAETLEVLDRQRQFVSDASHELRTPLTSVLANLELLVDVLDGEPGEAARSALRSTQRMRRLVVDLLLLARADAGRRAPHKPTDLRDVVVDAAAELGPITGEHRFAVSAEHAVVDGSRDDLHRLALNLMENALKHTPPETAVEVRVHTEGGEAILDVEDDGPGIPPELRDSLFDRFVRGGGDRSGSFGLGLSIVRAVAQTHGGRVTLEDPLDGVGARFVVRIPLVGRAPEAPLAEPPVPTRA
jgi:signal transduction histidine kinase